MKFLAALSLALVVATSMTAFGNSESAPLDENLESLRPFLGTWRGELKGSTPENPVIDVSHWERALNGKAVRVLHSINDGAYGGETIIYWDAETKTIAYDYFTTAGFRTRGTAKIDGRKFECHEIVKGSAEGVSEVKAHYELTADGMLKGRSQYLKKGEWVPGHEVSYKRAAGAQVVFK